MRHTSKRKWTLVGGLIVVVLGGAYFVTTVVFAKPRVVKTCGDWTFQAIHNGMTKDQITNLLGQPVRKLVKKSADENLLYQGSDEASIKEGWIYDVRDEPANSVEVHFGYDGRVNGKGCGGG